jgi:hypothetical protein
MIEKCLVTDVNLSLLQHNRHGNDDGELFRVAAKIVGHRQHGSIALTDEHDLRRLVEQLRVRLRHVKAAECEKRLAVPCHHDCQRREQR